MASQALSGAAPGGAASGIQGADSGAPAPPVLVGNVGQVRGLWGGEGAVGAGWSRARRLGVVRLCLCRLAPQLPCPAHSHAATLPCV